MELPEGVTTIDETDYNIRRYVLRLNKYRYGLKPSGHNWFENLRSGLTDGHFFSKPGRQMRLLQIWIQYIDLCR